MAFGVCFLSSLLAEAEAISPCCLPIGSMKDHTCVLLADMTLQGLQGPERRQWADSGARLLEVFARHPWEWWETEEGRGGGKAMTFALDLHGWPGASGSWHESGTRCWLAVYSWWLSPYPRPLCICSRRVKKNLVSTGTEFWLAPTSSSFPVSPSFSRWFCQLQGISSIWSLIV